MGTLVRYRGPVPPTNPPDIETIPRAPDSADVARWITCWTPVHYRTRGTWRIGIIRAWIRLNDGRWIAHIDHAGDGMHTSWQQTTWAVYAAGSIVPVDPVPHGVAGDD